MSISQWPADQRPRERLLKLGAARLADAELLAVLLRTGLPGKHAVELAREMLAAFGGVRALLDIPHEQARSHPGLGLVRWAQLQAARELARRSLRDELQSRDALASPTAVRDFLALWLRHRLHEVFGALFLDTRNQLIVAEEIFRGTLTQTAVYPRELARRALELNSAAIILSHFVARHKMGLLCPVFLCAIED